IMAILPMSVSIRNRVPSGISLPPVTENRNFCGIAGRATERLNLLVPGSVGVLDGMFFSHLKSRRFCSEYRSREKLAGTLAAGFRSAWGSWTAPLIFGHAGHGCLCRVVRRTRL